MGPLDAFWHLIHLFYPAVAVGCLSAAGAKLLWRAELRGVTWSRLAGWATAAGVIALLAGLVVFGRDGKMANYGVLCVAAAAALWWAGWRRGGR